MTHHESMCVYDDCPIEVLARARQVYQGSADSALYSQIVN